MINFVTKELCIFKLYGDIEHELVAFCDSELEKSSGVEYSIEVKRLDIKLEFLLKSGYSLEILDAFLKKFLARFNSFVYATDDVSLPVQLVKILKIHGLVISTAESMTGGNIAASIVKVPGASEVFFEGLVTYNALSKEDRLGVSRRTIMENTVVSKEVAFEMVRALINEHSSVGISITGYAPSVSPNRDDGTCFIGVACGLRTIVNKFVFSGDREAVIEQATNAALFLAIKLITDRFFRSNLS